MSNEAPSATDATAVGDVAVAATAEPTLRQWDAAATGIKIDPALVARLDHALVGVDGHIGFAVKDLGSGRGGVLDGNLELQSASLYKLPVLYTSFAAGLRMGDALPITDEALSYDAGTMELGAGETLTVAEALERMVSLSDNTSAILLASRVGGGRINATISSLGMTTTHYSLDRMTTSALDMLHLLEFVADGDAVSPSASADMVHLLLRQRVNDRLPRLLPDEVQTAHKTGNLPGTVNDVGILYGPSSTLVVAALVSDTSDETAAATGIARLASAAYSYFEDQPEVVSRPLLPPAPARPVPPVWREPRPPTPTPEPTEITPIASSEDVYTTPTAVVVSVAQPGTPAPTTAPVVATPTAPPGQKPSPTPAPPAPTATPAPPAATPTPQPRPTKDPTRAPTATPVPPKR
jgi:beta-lactamase class A